MQLDFQQEEPELVQRKLSLPQIQHLAVGMSLASIVLTTSLSSMRAHHQRAGVSSLVGVGGGSLLVPLLSWCNLPMRRAIGTSAAIGFFIASSGAVGSMMAGWGTVGLPKYSIGYVYLPAVAGIALLSTLTAPLGARLAHRVPVPMLKRGFSVLLCVIGLKMIMGLL